ncbi:MAG: hypothetical protein ACKJSK_15730 [Roseibacillus sp.]
MKKEDPGELQAYVKLMTEHQGNLRAFIVSLMPGSPDVGDVLQESNAALWEKRPLRAQHELFGVGLQDRALRGPPAAWGFSFRNILAGNPIATAAFLREVAVS